MTSFKIGANLKFIKKKEFDSVQLRLRQLVCLDFTGFNLVGETAMARLLDTSARTLKSFKVSYKQ